MAKKKTEKKVKKQATEVVVKKSETNVSNIKKFILDDYSDRITKLEQRIDRIVDAHERCKSLKGL